VGSGDVLLVGNYAHDAYFGGLNTLLAQRAGASGAVILGPTRDCRQTVAAGFPVFSQGRTSHDVKEYGCVKSLNTPIGGVFPGDLLFADEDGVVHIPWREESAILTRALEIARKEGQVRHDIVSGVSLSELKDKKF
jgi:regulator of RNase E activity RraA